MKKQTLEIEVPDGKKAVWKDGKVVFEDIEPQLPNTWEEFCKNYPIKNGEYFLVVSQNQENTLQYIATQMMRIGNYKTNIKQYNKQQQFITYGKNN